jgi:hypothetical protein
VKAKPALSPGEQEAIANLKTVITRIYAKADALGDRSPGVVLRPALEQHTLERLFEHGPQSERDLDKHLDDTDLWDIAAWADGAAEQGLIERVEPGSDETPLRRWQITDKGRETIGYPAAR